VSSAVRAVVCRELGSLDHLVIEERPAPVPGPGQAVVDVRAMGVNYVDGLICQGRYQMKPATPYVPGGELAGVVAAVADDVTRLGVGNRVMAMTGFGAFAEQVVVNVASLQPIPADLGFGQAAAFIQSYSTAWFTLTRRAAVHEGEWVLVLGAGGGIGLASVDVAVALGARVIAAASPPRS
jgi:NADPH2:quinone reductase